MAYFPHLTISVYRAIVDDAVVDDTKQHYIVRFQFVTTWQIFIGIRVVAGIVLAHLSLVLVAAFPVIDEPFFDAVELKKADVRFQGVMTSDFYNQQV